MPEDTVAGFVHQTLQVQMFEAKTALLGRVKLGTSSIVRTKSTEQPEQATTSTLVETTDSNRARDPSSPASSVDGNSLRQIRTRHSSVFFQKRKDMNLLAPLSSNSSPKHCSEATCSATSLIAQLKRCWNFA